MIILKARINNLFWLFSTYLLSPYYYFRILLRRGSGPDKILVVQTTKIGDLVCTTPVFREIRRCLPDCRLSALVISSTRDILKNNPHLDEIMTLDDYPGIRGRLRLIQKLRRERYSWVFNLSPVNVFTNILGWWIWAPHRVSTVCRGLGETVSVLAIFNNHRWEFRPHTSLLRHYLELLRFLGVKVWSEEKEIFVKPAEEKKASDFLEKHNLKSEDLLVGISVTSCLEFRQWKLERFASLADRLIEKLKARVIFIGAAEDYAKNEKVRKIMRYDSVNAAGEFRLNELPAFLKTLRLFISMDTGPIYIANALGVPVVDIASADDMREQSPSGPKCRLVQKNIDCAPCIFVFATTRRCAEGHFRCLEEITVEDVFKAAQELL